MIRSLNINDPLTKATLPYYLRSVKDAFVENHSVTKKLATITAIVPVAGCAFRYIDHAAEHGLASQSDLHIAYDVDAVVCVASDVLLFTPLFPVAILTKIISPMVVAYASGDLGQILDLDFVANYRELEWNQTYSMMKEHISSYKYKVILQKSYREEISASLYMISQQSALLWAGQLMALRNVSSREEAQAVNQTFHHQFMDVQREICREIKRINHRFEMQVPREVGSNIRRLKKEHYRQFTTEYYAKMKREEEENLHQASPWVKVFPRLGHQRYWSKVYWLLDQLWDSRNSEQDDRDIVWLASSAVRTSLDLYECGRCEGIYSSLDDSLREDGFDREDADHDGPCYGLTTRTPRDPGPRFTFTEEELERIRRPRPPLTFYEFFKASPVLLATLLRGRSSLNPPSDMAFP
ncbi:hypothetical protein CDD80_875 [Ophiocordyceps camponoti-rufipedis]|uniref:Uncharacterized protein n=1 Tax=Ophiocordyceps camponoti-rufipedis TaxID=2004952 RepID=A0A2C5XN38_9HYPO|nr:hypothetical protein CDD80_875 [Ophiocordyceps camponoti-rufipedis]